MPITYERESLVPRRTRNRNFNFCAFKLEFRFMTVYKEKNKGRLVKHKHASSAHIQK